MDLYNSESKLAGYRRFFVSKSLYNYCHTMVMTGMRITPPMDIKYVLFEFEASIKSLRQIKGYLIMIYIQVHTFEGEETKKDTMFKYRFLCYIN